MKNQVLFSLIDKSKKIKMSVQFLFGALRVNDSQYRWQQLHPEHTHNEF